MQQKYNVIIADTSCFILLDKIGELNILEKVFHLVTTKEDIAAEFRKELPDWITVRTVSNRDYQRLLCLEVDNGEASAIALSVEDGNALLIIDDNKARKLTAKLQLAYTGNPWCDFKGKADGYYCRD